MINKVLVVCVGNICRSPVGEHLLKQLLPHMAITSAGIGAVIGAPADKTAADVAREKGLLLDGHIARQFNPAEAAKQDLILVMEPAHRRDILTTDPHLQGRIMLFDQWTTGTGIRDPYRKTRDIHVHVFEQIQAAAGAWAQRLSIA